MLKPEDVGVPVIDSMDACAIARRKVETMASRVDAELERVVE